MREEPFLYRPESVRLRNRGFQCLLHAINAVHHGSSFPMGEIGIFLPGVPLRVQEDARARITQEFIHLAAGIAQILFFLFLAFLVVSLIIGLFRRAS